MECFAVLSAVTVTEHGTCWNAAGRRGVLDRQPHFVLVQTDPIAPSCLDTWVMHVKDLELGALAYHSGVVVVVVGERDGERDMANSRLFFDLDVKTHITRTCIC